MKEFFRDTAPWNQDDWVETLLMSLLWLLIILLIMFLIAFIYGAATGTLKSGDGNVTAPIIIPMGGKGGVMILP